jgi:hypothetical protein
VASDLRRAAGSSENKFASVSRALNQLENRILDLCKMEILLVSKQCSSRLVRLNVRWRDAWRGQPDETIRFRSEMPAVVGLSARWLREADDGK